MKAVGRLACTLGIAAGLGVGGCGGGKGNGGDGPDETPPTVSIRSPADASVVRESISVVAEASDDVAVASVELSIDGTEVGNRDRAPYAFAIDTRTLADGDHTVSALARDGAGNRGSDEISLTFDNTAPDVQFASPGDGETVSGAITASVQASDNHSLRGVRIGVDGATGDLISAPPFERAIDTRTLSNGAHSFTAVAIDAAGNESSAQIGVVVDNASGVIEAGVDPTRAYTVAEATAFLYSGPQAIQTGVLPGTIERRRGAVVQGRIRDAAGAPLNDVQISVLGHAELGQTRSRADGQFAMVVNGGGMLTVQLRKDGFLPVDRQVRPGWNAFDAIPDVVMIPMDGVVNVVDLSQPGMKRARGSEVVDADGARQATLLIADGTAAQAVSADGTSTPLDTLSLRLTEYTVGELGPEAMPALLPPASAYTYAVEFTVDEALTAARIELSPPAVHYVENFVGFPVGAAVPAGFYDRAAGHWEAWDNGRVVEVVGRSGDLADLDLDGDGVADGASARSELGVTDDERREVAALYPDGTTLWRTPIPHFTPLDCNWPYVPPDDAVPPDQPPPGRWDPENEEDEDCRSEDASIIECRNRVLREDLPLMGTPYRLTYRSDRVRGHVGAYTLDVELTGADVPASLKRVELVIRVAGRSWSWNYDDPGPDLSQPFEWDGRDAWNQDVSGSTITALVLITYVYDAEYLASIGERVRLFAQLPVQDGSLVAVPARGEFRFVQAMTEFLHPVDVKSSHGYAGWSLSHQHRYDPVARILERGDGTRRTVGGFGGVALRSVVGDGQTGFRGDGGPATEASLSLPHALEVGPDGSLYIADTYNNRIRRVDPSGRIDTALFLPPVGGQQGSLLRGVAVAPDGDIYAPEYNFHRIRKYDAQTEMITVVAGTGPGGPFEPCVSSGDGGLAVEAGVCNPAGVAVADDGSLYIAESGGHRIRRVGPDGIITTVAGGGATLGDGGPAAQARLLRPTDVSLGPDGVLYIADWGQQRIRRVSRGGIITTVAGGGADLSDGIPALSARLVSPTSVAATTDGRVYLTDFAGNRAEGRLRVVRPDGRITTVAGGGPEPGSQWARRAEILAPHDVAVGPEGELYVLARDEHRAYRVGAPMPGIRESDVLIPARDGAEVYQFDAGGRHLRTLHPLTGAPLFELAYNDDGYLESIYDADGNQTLIQRTEDNDPVAVVAPEGLTTTFALDDDGYLRTFTDPTGRSHSFDYGPGGLLTEHRDRRDLPYRYVYDDRGRLTRAEDPAGGFRRFERREFMEGGGHEVTVTTAEGVPTVYRTESLASGGRRLTTSFPGGGQVVLDRQPDGTQVATYSDGTTAELRWMAEPRWGVVAPLAAEVRIRLPSGIEYVASTDRTVSLDDELNPLAVAQQATSITINGASTTTVYDGASRSLTTTTPAGRTLVTRLDARGAVTAMEPYDRAAFTYGYDPRGRLLTTTQGEGQDARTTVSSYDPHGRLASVTFPEGLGVTYRYGEDHRLDAIVHHDGRVIDFSFDANGNATEVAPPGRDAHRFGHTDVNLLQSYEPPDLGGGASEETRYTYDADRRLLEVSRPNGPTVVHTYDVQGRLDDVDLGAGRLLTFGYDDATGHVVSASGPDGLNETFLYDGAYRTGRTWSGPVQGKVELELNPNLRVGATTVNDAYRVPFTYDGDRLVIQAGDLSLNRDPESGQLTSTTLGQVTTSHTYDDFGAPESLRVKHGDTTLYEATYDRDDRGRVERVTETVGGLTKAIAYEYDDAGRLTEVRHDGVVAETYSYDANGNRTGANGSGATFDGRDRVLTHGALSFEHDASGLRLREIEAGDAIVYGYDARGSLLTVDRPNTTDDIAYIVDSDGRRVGKKAGGVLVQGFLYKNQMVVAELDGDHNVVSRFIYATPDYVPDAMVKGGANYRIIRDHTGSPRLVVHAETGTVAQRLDYDAYGNITRDTNPGFIPFGFASGLHDRDTGWVRFGARDYDPVTGRWTTPDPVRFAGGQTNLYVYVFDDPVNLRDPYGLGSEGQAPCSYVVYDISGNVNVNPMSCGGGFDPEEVDAIQPGFPINEGDVIETGRWSKIRIGNADQNVWFMIGPTDSVTIPKGACHGGQGMPFRFSDWLMSLIGGPGDTSSRGRTAVNVRG
jgi:RHS repeat-associated protein